MNNTPPPVLHRLHVACDCGTATELGTTRTGLRVLRRTHATDCPLGIYIATTDTACPTVRIPHADERAR